MEEACGRRKGGIKGAIGRVGGGGGVVREEEEEEEYKAVDVPATQYRRGGVYSAEKVNPGTKQRHACLNGSCFRFLA